jgi:hypothetical protein
MMDINKVKAEAEAEVREEQMKRAKERIKCKLRELESAKKIVGNIQRELDDLYVEIGNSP